MEMNPGESGDAPNKTSSMLGWVAAVIEIESPSQPSPAVIQTMWTSSTRVLVAMLYLLERGLLVVCKEAVQRIAAIGMDQLQSMEVTRTKINDNRGYAKVSFVCTDKRELA